MEHIYLSHHGIKGQKWGVRRFQLKNGRLTAAGKKRYSEDEEERKKKAEEESAPKKKSVSEMSDQELREAINRAQLEESYRRYYEPAQQPKVDAGQKFVQAAQDVLKKQVLDPALSSAARSISSAIDKKINEKFGTKPKSINDLLKTDVRKLSPDELQKVVNYNNNLKTYREQQKYNSTDAGVDRMQQERMDKRKRQIDMEQQELNLRMKRATVEKVEEERRKAKETVMDVVKDVASQSVNEHRSPSEERAKAVVDKYFNEPLMLPKPDDDLEHSDILEHHGIKGQKWGVRRYQKEDGHLTRLGKARQKHYAKTVLKTHIKNDKSYVKRVNRQAKKAEKKNDDILYKEYVKLGEQYTRDLVREKEYLTKIKDKSVEAGKDYIATRTYNIAFDILDGVGLTKTTTLSTNTGIELRTRHTTY